jgi:hypothetical protein
MFLPLLRFLQPDQAPMSPFPSIAPAFLEEMVAYLLHLFVRGAGGDEAAARHAVLSTLAAQDVTDEDEMRLAAEIISFSFAALEALARSMAPDLPLKEILRLRGNANAAHRSAHQCQRSLDKLRQERRSGSVATPTQPEAEAHNLAPATPLMLSRQQRRDQERKTAKALRQQADRARLEARMAMRTGAVPIAVAQRAAGGHLSAAP